MVSVVELPDADFVVLDSLAELPNLKRGESTTVSGEIDEAQINWLEGYLANYKKTVLIISHDRYFLDRTTEKTMQIQDGAAKLFHGNYSKAKLQMEAERASLEKRYKEQQKEIERIRKNIEFQRRCNREGLVDNHQFLFYFGTQCANLSHGFQKLFHQFVTFVFQQLVTSLGCSQLAFQTG